MSIYKAQHVDIHLVGPLMDELIDSAGLFIRIRDENEVGIEIVFEQFRSYRYMDEGDSLVMLDDFAKTPTREHWLFTVEDSQFLEWFHEQTLGMSRDTKLTHYLIVTDDEFIDVLSEAAPIVRQRHDAVRNWTRS